MIRIGQTRKVIIVGLKDGVLIGDFHHQHARIFGQCFARVWIFVRQQFARIILLHLNVRRIELVENFAHVKRACHTRWRAGIHAPDMQINVHINAVLLQFVNQKLHAVDHLGGKMDAVLLHDAARRRPCIHVVKADDIKAKLAQMRCHFRRYVLGRSDGVKAKVSAKEARALAIGRDEVPITYFNARKLGRLGLRPDSRLAL